jgi:hypothetical protein
MISKQEFFNQFNSGQNQYTYFIMAIDASGIGFAISKVDQKNFACPLILFSLAIISWAISFFAGIRFQQLKNENLLIEYKNLDIREGDFPGINSDKTLIEQESAKLKSQAESAQKKMHIMYNLLNYFMILGMILFIIYQIWEMMIRTENVISH